jgi:hypothetical protein
MTPQVNTDFKFVELRKGLRLALLFGIGTGGQRRLNREAPPSNTNLNRL